MKSSLIRHKPREERAVLLLTLPFPCPARFFWWFFFIAQWQAVRLLERGGSPASMQHSLFIMIGRKVINDYLVDSFTAINHTSSFFYYTSMSVRTIHWSFSSLCDKSWSEKCPEDDIWYSKSVSFSSKTGFVHTFHLAPPRSVRLKSVVHIHLEAFLQWRSGCSSVYCAASSQLWWWWAPSQPLRMTATLLSPSVGPMLLGTSS